MAGRARTPSTLRARRARRRRNRAGRSTRDIYTRKDPIGCRRPHHDRRCFTEAHPFAKIREPLRSDLLALQTDSFDWLIGNERWQDRVIEATESGDESVATVSGLEEIFEEISPIEDFAGAMSLSFREHRFEPPKYSVDECKERDMTYSAPLFVTAEFMNNNTGEIKSQTVFMGDFPLMTPQGTSSSTASERVVVSQLVRSPGAYFETTPDRTSDKDIFTAKIIPSRGAWLEFEIDKRDQVGVRLDRKRKQSVTVLLKALGWSESKILEEFGDYESIRETLAKDTVQTQDEALLDIYRKLRPAEPATTEAARTLLNNLYFNPKRYNLDKVGRYKINRKLDGRAMSDSKQHEDIVALPHRRPARRPETLGVRDGEASTCASRRHRPLRQLPTAAASHQNQVRTGLS